MMRIALAVLFLFASTASAQVTVEVRTLKRTFLQGEPIYIVLDVKNVSQYAIGYEPIEHGQSLAFDVPGLQPYEWRTVCESGWVHGGMIGGVSHPPTFDPGQVKSFRYLLRGYRLVPGRHRVRVSGKAPVRWFQYQVLRTTGEPGPPPVPYGPGERVEGAAIDREIEIEVVAASTAEVQQALAPLVLKSEDLYDTDLARAGIFESAHPFHTDVIARLAAHPNFGSGAAYEALADINTVESRAHLRRLHDESADLEQRSAIVEALGRLSHADSLDFFASLLPGRMTKHDEWIKRSAVQGLECIGGESAEDAIVDGIAPWQDQGERLRILQRVASRRSVDAIVDLQLGSDEQLLMSACSTLSGLTRYEWCDLEPLLSALYPTRDATRVRQLNEATQARWRNWWPRNRAKVRIYKRGEPESTEPLPKIW